MIRSLWISTTLAACLPAVVGCAPKPKPVVATPIANVWESPPPPLPPLPRLEPLPDLQTQPADQGLDISEPIAVVNGEPLSQSTLVNRLIESHGLTQLEQMILLAVARQRAAALGFQVTPADTRAMHEDALKRLATPIVDPNARVLDTREAQRLLDDFLEARNISRREWDLRMEQKAYLRKIAEAEIAKTTISDDMLRNEYEQDYGEKVQVRHIQVGSLAAATRVRALLGANKDFELVARQMSENQVTAAQGGLARPFTRNDPGVTPLLREAAFKLKGGEISEAIRDGSVYHIIRLERRFPASDIGFENADRTALRRKLLDRLIQQREQDLEVELFQSANVDIRNAELARQYRERHRPGRSGQ